METYRTTYVVLRRAKHEMLAIFETPDGNYQATLDFLELKLDGWRVHEAKEVYTDLVRYPDIVPQYTI